jgi:hypothetical protein
VAEAVKPAHESILTTEDRVGFFHDTWAFGKAGLLATSEALELAYQLRHADECKLLRSVVEDAGQYLYVDCRDHVFRLHVG